MLGHSGAIMELHFSTDGNSIFTASTDQTVGIWDIESGTRIKRLKGKLFLKQYNCRNLRYADCKKVTILNT